MTVQEKTAAIQQEIAVHQVNLAAVAAANVPQGFNAVVVAALTKVLTEKLAEIFDA